MILFLKRGKITLNYQYFDNLASNSLTIRISSETMAEKSKRENMRGFQSRSSVCSSKSSWVLEYGLEIEFCNDGKKT
jgi:hypothetical protein